MLGPLKGFIFILIGLLSIQSFSQSVPQPSVHRYIAEDQGLPKALLTIPDSAFVYTKVDSIITTGIQNNAFPGAQLLVAKQGEIVFHETYGYHTYDSLVPVSKTDLYDLASITKVAAPLLAIMKLVDEEKLDLDEPFSKYWKPWLKYPDKKNLSLREILAHQAGLEPYIVFLSDVMKKGRLKRRFVKPQSEPKFQKQAFEHLFVKNRFKNKMQRTINRSQVNKIKKYRYSGLAFLIFPDLIAKLSGQDFNQYLIDNFYKPLGCKTLRFNPVTYNFPNAIVPTEKDTIFRKALTRGWVHDENASLLGGVSGNAGLFGTAQDLAIIMQLLQNYGSFKDRRYLSKEVIKEFSRVQFPENDNRRGLGFDKPLLDNSELSINKSYPAPEASSESFGHSGFTGTFAWADPKNQLVFIFLSNRVYPFRTNRNLYELNIRSSLHQVFYKAWQPH